MLKSGTSAFCVLSRGVSNAPPRSLSPAEQAERDEVIRSLEAFRQAVRVTAFGEVLVPGEQPAAGRDLLGDFTEAQGGWGSYA